jgi:hypothetical protein
MFQYKCTIFREHKMPVLKPVTYNCYLQDSSIGDTVRIWYYIEGVPGGIVNNLWGSSMDYSK